MVIRKPSYQTLFKIQITSSITSILDLPPDFENPIMKVLFVSSGNAKNFDIVPFIKEQGESLKKAGVNIDYYPVIGKSIRGYLTSALQLRKKLKTDQYDLIHAHFTLSGVVALLGSRGDD